MYDVGYAGLRMTSEEYLALGETDVRYELIDGMVMMKSPDPPVHAVNHNEICAEVSYQIKAFAGSGRTLRVFPETQVQFAKSTVYMPDVAVYQASRLPKHVVRLDLTPDLVVEVLSPVFRGYDLITKQMHYECYGVPEYWVIDPDNGAVRWWRRDSERGRFDEGQVEGDTLASSAIPGLVIDLHAIRAALG